MCHYEYIQCNLSICLCVSGARSLSTTAQLQAQGKSLLTRSDIIYIHIKIQICSLVEICFKWELNIVSLYLLIYLFTLSISLSTCYCLYFPFSSDKEQKDIGSAWCEEHSSGGRSSNPFPVVWNHVRLYSFLKSKFTGCSLSVVKENL